MNKQIEVLGNDINAYTPCPMRPIDCDILAQELYEAGYRKQEDADGWKEIAETYQQMFENARTDVAREIFAEIEKCFCGRLIWCPEETILDEVMFTELKEKYGV